MNSLSGKSLFSIDSILNATKGETEANVIKESQNENDAVYKMDHKRTQTFLTSKNIFF